MRPIARSGVAVLVATTLSRCPAHAETKDPAEAIRGTRKRTCLPIDPFQ
ncbi:hypothetical protein ACFOZ5_08975 [Marinobacter lacisalsi]|uniref:Uncharacterized protein n=1 Tax=Marinobacter lacisalsi TaxID=475979 RepID=A0ABV8QJA5_9GAMM